MKVTDLILSEMRYRKTGFLLIAGIIAVASGFLCAVLLLLRAYDQSTEAIVKQKRKTLEKQMEQMAEDYRKIGVGMGFNVLILPSEQNLADFYSDDYASKIMPEEYAHQLADSKIVSVRHLLPSLSQKIVWPEMRRKIVLTGIKGEIPRMHFSGKERNPILDVIPESTIVVGRELCQSLNLEVGQIVRLMGRPFKIQTCHEQRGNLDDITAWINLAEAQELLGKKGSINAILALECRCVGSDNLVNMAKVRQDIQSVLPNTRVIEFMSRAIARAEGRWKVVTVAQEAIEAERVQRLKVRSDREKMAGLLIPVIVIGAALSVAFLSYANIRSRRSEIGVLRALGFSSSKVFFIFYVKALLAATVGSFGGTLFSSASMVYIHRSIEPLAEGFQAAAAISVYILVAALILTALTSWLPAWSAVQQDPARILGKE